MEKEKLPSEISASSVTIEVTDMKTGQVLRRDLPIDYYENVNCIRLRGEDMSGKASELIFYSNVGLSRLKDLTGGGPDHDPCGGHGKNAK